ncbi:filamentous hemagglutinin N-terminal domain-containing protein [Acetobacter sp. TBRC 12305]|uniref:Filamentous hemagglutinin N-terminal domain-containing protein n=1 Tax=Acetobacter garciniae TaxID=2817435 RepID=A0A939HRF3_9PROT|nr:filamentous hemagglutinin N-terminal domain-containing protein [Acetobacter garciniae]MBO1326509.1 filamentous hemagglutinin N-terminal domain-containing protein [Acetobacter garciniae]MBX0346175.1 filamentous hemagglutinin N-terminal domain-containing protein [Acetobacter garciniae]
MVSHKANTNRVHGWSVVVCRAHFAMCVGLIWATSAYGQTLPAPTTLPQGGEAVGGSASIGAPVVTGSTATLTVNQTAPNAIVNWSSFDVGAKASVNFVQPSSTAMILNRVTGDKTSNIAGSISANGVFILENPSGAILYNGANISAQSVIITPSHIDDTDFENGVLSFSSPTGSSIASPAITIDQGATISAGQAGLVGLVAPQVSNAGTLTANLGTIVLAGGVTAFTLDLYGDGLVNFDITDKIGAGAVSKDTVLVTNSSTGKLSAPGGRVQLTAQAADGVVSTLVNAGGQVDAGANGTISIQGIGGNITIAGDLLSKGTDTQSGGAVSVDAQDGAVVTQASSTIDTSGGAQSGNVSIQAQQSSQLAGTITTPGNVTITTPVQAPVTQTGTINAGAVDFAGPAQIASTGSVNADSVEFDMSTQLAGTINAPYVGIAPDAALSLSGNGRLDSAATLDDDGTFDISGATGSVSIGALYGGGIVALGSNNLTLTQASGGTDDVSDGSAFIGNITDGGIAGGVGGSLTVQSGGLMLFGDNSYTGPTIIDNGATLALIDGSIASSSSVVDNGTFDISSSWAPQITSLSGNGTVLLGDQGLTITNASGTFGGTLTPGPYSEGDGGLTLTGGTQILTGENSYTGTTTVASGATLQLGDGGQGGSVATDIVNDGTLVLDHNTDTVLGATAITGTGQLQIEGGGTVSQAAGTGVSQSLVSTGDTAFNGSIVLDGDNTIPALGRMLATGAITVRTNGALDLTGLVSTPGTVTLRNNGTLLESANGAINAAVLTTGTDFVAGDTTLSGANEIGTLGRFVVQDGTFVLNNATALTLEGPLAAHAVDVTAVGGMTLAGGGSLFLSPRSAADASTLTLNGNAATLLQAGNFYINDGPLQSAYANAPAMVTFAVPGTGSVVLGGADRQLVAATTDLVLRLGNQVRLAGNVDLLSLTLYGGATADLEGTLDGVTGTQAASKARAYSSDTTRDLFNGCAFGVTDCTPVSNASPVTANAPVIINPLSGYDFHEGGSGNSAGTSQLAVKGSQPKDALGSDPLFSYSPRSGRKHKTDGSVYLPGVAGQDY